MNLGRKESKLPRDYLQIPDFQYHFSHKPILNSLPKISPTCNLHKY